MRADQWVRRVIIPFIVGCFMLYAPLELTRVILLNAGKEQVFYTPVHVAIIEIACLWACFLAALTLFIKVGRGWPR